MDIVLLETQGVSCFFRPVPLYEFSGGSVGIVTLFPTLLEALVISMGGYLALEFVGLGMTMISLSRLFC